MNLWKSWYLNWPMMELNTLEEMQRIYLATDGKLTKAQKFKDLCSSKAHAGSQPILYSFWEALKIVISFLSYSRLTWWDCGESDSAERLTHGRCWVWPVDLPWSLWTSLVQRMSVIIPQHVGSQCPCMVWCRFFKTEPQGSPHPPLITVVL